MRSTLDHERERHLRRAQTEAERTLWWLLRNRRLQGWKFRRQHRIGRYFADFACLEAGLVIELDGSQPLDCAVYDAARTACLKHAGFDVLRFRNDQVLRDTEAVLIAITIALAPHLPSAPSLRWHGEKEAPKRLSASPTTAASARRSG
jgi:very-short-patch-repair endonuclease